MEGGSCGSLFCVWRNLKATGRENGFTGKVQRIARVHQFGLKDRPNVHAQDVQYTERQLLGFSLDDNKMIKNAILEHLV